MKKDLFREMLDKEQTLDIQTIMQLKNGRRLIWRILEQAGIYRTFEGDEKDIVRQAGKRDLGLFIMAIVSEACEDEVFLMMKEAQERAKEERRYYDDRDNGNSESEHHYGYDFADGGAYQSGDSEDGEQHPTGANLSDFF